MADAYDTSKYDPRGQFSLMAIDATDEEIRNLLAEKDVKALRVVPFVWDTTSLSNVRMTQPLTADGITDLEEATKNVFWAENRMQYDTNNNVEYLGLHDTLGAPTSDTNWQIKKMTYDGTNVIRIQRQITSWDDRASGW